MSIDIAIEIESTGIPICMNIAIIDDNVVERQEMFQLNLTTSSDLVIFAEPRVANVTILDNDSKFYKIYCLPEKLIQAFHVFLQTQLNYCIVKALHCLNRIAILITCLLFEFQHAITAATLLSSESSSAYIMVHISEALQSSVSVDAFTFLA